MDPVAAVFLALLTARRVDQDAPHQLRRDRKKMSAVLPVHLTLPNEFQIRLVDKHSGLQSAGSPFVRHVTRGDEVQLVVLSGISRARASRSPPRHCWSSPVISVQGVLVRPISS